MKKQIIIGISIAIIPFVVSIVVIQRSSKILDKEIQNQKKSYQNDSIAKVKADSALTSCKKMQLDQFSELVRKLKESPDFFRRMNNVHLFNGEEYDPFFIYAMSHIFDLSTKPNLPPIDDLDNWSSFNFIYLEFPDDFWGKPGVLSILCDNRDKRNPKFFPRIRMKEIYPTYKSEFLIAYHVARGRPEFIPEMEIQRYVLEAIECALHAIKIKVSCDRVLSSLIHMEQQEELGYKPPSVVITTKDTVK